jgi:hypothetical protein
MKDISADAMEGALEGLGKLGDWTSDQVVLCIDKLDEKIKLEEWSVALLDKCNNMMPKFNASALERLSDQALANAKSVLKLGGKQIGDITKKLQKMGKDNLKNFCDNVAPAAFDAAIEAFGNGTRWASDKAKEIIVPKIKEVIGEVKSWDGSNIKRLGSLLGDAVVDNIKDIKASTFKAATSTFSKAKKEWSKINLQDFADKAEETFDDAKEWSGDVVEDLGVFIAGLGDKLPKITVKASISIVPDATEAMDKNDTQYFTPEQLKAMQNETRHRINMDKLEKMTQEQKAASIGCIANVTCAHAYLDLRCIIPQNFASQAECDAAVSKAQTQAKSTKIEKLCTVTSDASSNSASRRLGEATESTRITYRVAVSSTSNAGMVNVAGLESSVIDMETNGHVEPPEQDADSNETGNDVSGGFPKAALFAIIGGCAVIALIAAFTVLYPKHGSSTAKMARYTASSQNGTEMVNPAFRIGDGLARRDSLQGRASVMV